MVWRTALGVGFEPTISTLTAWRCIYPATILWDQDSDLDHCINSAGFCQLNYPRGLWRGQLNYPRTVGLIKKSRLRRD